MINLLIKERNTGPFQCLTGIGHMVPAAKYFIDHSAGNVPSLSQDVLPGTHFSLGAQANYIF